VNVYSLVTLVSVICTTSVVEREDSVVGIVTWPQAGQCGVLFQAGARGFFLIQNV
jgi:hypothetical protein